MQTQTGNTGFWVTLLGYYLMSSGVLVRAADNMEANTTALEVSHLLEETLGLFFRVLFTDMDFLLVKAFFFSAVDMLVET